MALPSYTMRQLLEAGVHFGHQTQRWNPKMGPHLFGVRNKVHIIDLQQTVPLLHRALATVRDIVASGGRVLFVGTKRQASEPVMEAAKRCGQYYVNHRWLGGTLTNWNTISVSIKRLRELDQQLAEDNIGLTKKELLRLNRERDKLERSLGGIKEMGGLPDILFVIDTNKEAIAVKEANKLGIPIIAVVDSNSNPENITHIVPGNDDALRAINLYCDLAARAVLDGLQQEIATSGGDIGEAEDAPAEDLPARIIEAVNVEAAVPNLDAEDGAGPAASPQGSDEQAGAADAALESSGDGAAPNTEPGASVPTRDGA